MTTLVPKQIAELHTLDHGQLKARWRERFDTDRRAAAGTSSSRRSPTASRS